MRLFLLTFFTLIIAACGPRSDKSVENPHSTKPTTQTQVVVIGTIHSQHLSSERYSLAVLEQAIRRIAPDQVLTEIPPDRFPQAAESFRLTGKVSEPRVERFPEYIDLLFPLQKELGFEIVPTAAWTRPMAEFRADALNRLARDEARADDWQAYTRALDAMNETLKSREDDPLFIHTDGYDAIIKQGLAPYAELFHDDLGPGSWERINEAHYELIAQAINKAIDQGKSGQPDATVKARQTLLITFGAAHKYWFLERLRARDDITVVDARAFFEDDAAPVPDLR